MKIISLGEKTKRSIINRFCKLYKQFKNKCDFYRLQNKN